MTRHRNPVKGVQGLPESMSEAPRFTHNFLIDPPLIGEVCEKGTQIQCLGCMGIITLEDNFPAEFIMLRTRYHVIFECLNRSHPN